jgi:hypothetical protein
MPIENISLLKVGDNVCYVPAHGKPENGVVKEIPEHTKDSVRVVYNCNGEWHNYKDYTSALTNLRDLEIGWIH